MTRTEALKYRAQIENSAVGADDETALEQKWMYPAWMSGESYDVGERLRYGENLYRVVQAHISQTDWTPDITPALYQIVKIGHSGTIDDPIEAAVGLNYVKDLYYIEESGDKYLCIRQDTDEGTVLYYLPHELVGVYFEAV